MQTETQSFEVVVRRKVPFVTSFLFHALIILGLILFLINIFFLPSTHSSDEMKVAYFILVIPDIIKKALIISGIGFLIVLPLYLGLRLYKSASLIFNVDRITITGSRINLDMPVERIQRVYCMDSTNLQGESRNKLTIYFQQRRDKTIRVRLKHYEQLHVFMDRLTQYENIDFKFYDFNVSPDPENEI